MRWENCFHDDWLKNLFYREEKSQMKAIALVPGTTLLRLVERPEPVITAPDEVKMKVLQVGICGTDREEASGGRAEAPPGKTELVIGHEMFGQVVEAGSAVHSVKPGDDAVFSVRRSCGYCPACAVNRSDMCSSGNYTERGIKGQDGYQTEYVVDSEKDLVKIPKEMASIGVLTEPTSVVEKAIDEAVLIQATRLPEAADPSRWLEGKRVLVAGIGPIGLLAAFALRLRGANVSGLGRQDPNTVRPSMLTRIGATYVDERQIRPNALKEHLGQMDLIFEATGAARLEFDLLSALGMNGLYVLTGIPGGDRPMNIEGATLMRQLVLRNQVMVGSVNASRKHFQMAVEDLGKARKTWGNTIDQMITHRFPYTQFAVALSLHSTDEIKTILEWGTL
jgi:threonine dehydrogenase-like Zn-dependent dehydrogenase